MKDKRQKKKILETEEGAKEAVHSEDNKHYQKAVTVVDKDENQMVFKPSVARNLLAVLERNQPGVQ